MKYEKYYCNILVILFCLFCHIYVLLNHVVIDTIFSLLENLHEGKIFMSNVVGYLLSGFVIYFLFLCCL